MITNENTTMPYMNSLSSCLNKMIGEGYKEDFKVTEQGLQSTSTNKTYSPNEVKVVNFFRFEGPSDPDENAIMYVIETSDGVKGTLVDAYGAYSDTNVDGFIKEVEDISKKVNKE